RGRAGARRARTPPPAAPRGRRSSAAARRARPRWTRRCGAGRCRRRRARGTPRWRGRGSPAGGRCPWSRSRRDRCGAGRPRRAPPRWRRRSGSSRYQQNLHPVGLVLRCAHASCVMRPALTTPYESRSPVALPLASVQRYTLATDVPADVNRSLDQLAQSGLQDGQALDLLRRPQERRAALDASGLASPTGHAPLLSDELWTPDGSIPTPANEVVFEAAAEIGMKTVIDPMVPTERWLTEDGVKDIADRLNAASEKAKEFGLTVGYHKHAQEFLADFDGKTASQRFLSLVDPTVAIELDLYWALVGGQDVVALVEELGDRLVAIHVKDGIKP